MTRWTTFRSPDGLVHTAIGSYGPNSMMGCEVSLGFIYYPTVGMQEVAGEVPTCWLCLWRKKRSVNGEEE